MTGDVREVSGNLYAYPHATAERPLAYAWKSRDGWVVRYGPTSTPLEPMPSKLAAETRLWEIAGVAR